jgi:cytochrome c553
MEYLNMKTTLSVTLFAALAAASQALAAPSSHVVWDSATRALLASGEAAAGQTKAAGCAGCHGAEGVSPSPNYPSLAGQVAAYTFKQLKDYQDGTRSDSPLMAGLVAGLSDQDMADLAAFYAGKPLPAPKGSTDGSADDLAAGVGGMRQIPPCDTCHGRKGEGKIVDIPALAGQHATYLESTLQNYKGGKRSNDIYSRMRLISEKLTDGEIKALAAYYEALGGLVKIIMLDKTIG